MENPEFLWGAATSSHQVEGNNKFNDWWQWETQNKIKVPSGIACNHYQLFREDIDLISRLGHNAHRFSLEWSRFSPEKNTWNEEAFQHYEQVLIELTRRGIEPVVTLHHFTNPVWFNREGGWESREALPYFLEFVEKAVSRLGKYVRYWITINEPLIYLYHGFLGGLWPPGHQSFSVTLRAMRNLMEAHIQSYKIIHSLYEGRFRKPVWVSIAKHMSHCTPCRPDHLPDRLAVYFRNWLFNDGFLDAVWNGFVFFPGMFCEQLSGDRTLDFIGVNYYSRDFIRFSGLVNDQSIGVACDKKHHKEDVRELNQMGWEVYPEGIYHCLMRLKKFKLPVIITENGICAFHDEQRSRFIRDHVEQVARVRRDGIPVLGYLYWSLMDNFEWAYGFAPRFGIVEVDYGSQQRNIRASAYVLAETCRKLGAEISGRHT